ncbi:MAG: DUF1573 domain-containing protein [Bacteroidota bacterium]|nr:DUF1573 domain-containing protein [Bacteroidota bacterium]
MKKILLLAVFAAAFSATNMNAQVTPNVDPSAPVMTFKTDTMNFGTVTQGTVVEKEFVFKNSGKTPLLITETNVTCGCTVPDYPKEPIAPGKTGVIKVKFNSAGKMGAQDKTITIVSNNANGQIVLHLKGTIVAAPATPAEGGK